MQKFMEQRRAHQGAPPITLTVDIFPQIKEGVIEGYLLINWQGNIPVISTPKCPCYRSVTLARDAVRARANVYGCMLNDREIARLVGTVVSGKNQCLTL